MHNKKVLILFQEKVDSFMKEALLARMDDDKAVVVQTVLEAKQVGVTTTKCCLFVVCWGLTSLLNI